MLMFEKEDLLIRADSERISAVYCWRRICLITLLFKSTLLAIMSSLLGLNKTPIGNEKGCGIFGFASIIEINLTANPWCRSTLIESERCGVTNCGACRSKCYCDRFPRCPGFGRQRHGPPRVLGPAHRPAERAARPGSCGLDIDAARRPDVLWHRRDGARPVEHEFSAPPRQASAHRRLERAARSGRCGPDIDASRRPYVLRYRRDGARPSERRSVPPAAACAGSISIGCQRRPQIDARDRAGRINPIPRTRASPRRSRRAPNARHSHIESSRTSDTNTAAAWPRRVDPDAMARRAHGRGGDRSTAGTAFTRCPTFCRKAVYPAREGIPRTSP